MKIETENFKEFKRLWRKYNTITAEHLESENVDDAVNALNHMTGFGKRETCTLCVAVNGNCTKCVWGAGDIHNVSDCVSDNTYLKIYYSKSKREVVANIRNRAKYMEEFLKEYYDMTFDDIIL